MRILILIAIGLLLYIILRGLLRQNNSAKQPENLGEMVACQYCKLHILKKEAIKTDIGYFCSQEHYDAEINQS